MVLKLNQVEISSVCNVAYLLCWTICKLMVLRSRRDCNSEYEDLVR